MSLKDWLSRNQQKDTSESSFAPARQAVVEQYAAAETSISNVQGTDPMELWIYQLGLAAQQKVADARLDRLDADEIERERVINDHKRAKEESRVREATGDDEIKFMRFIADLAKKRS